MRVLNRKNSQVNHHTGAKTMTRNTYDLLPCGRGGFYDLTLDDRAIWKRMFERDYDEAAAMFHFQSIDTKRAVCWFSVFTRDCGSVSNGATLLIKTSEVDPEYRQWGVY